MRTQRFSVKKLEKNNVVQVILAKENACECQDCGTVIQNLAANV